MKLENLLDYLKLEEPGEFQFFEDFADLIEMDTEIDSDTMYSFLSQVDLATFAQLINSYFEEALESLPEDAMNIYTLLDTAKMSFIGMANHIEKEGDLVLLSEEFARFKTWYALDSKVKVISLDKQNRLSKETSVRDAIVLARLERLGQEQFEYIFSGALDFKLDQYTIDFADLAAIDLQEKELENDEEPEDIKRGERIDY
ncbi:MAG: hypothetical protein RSD88_01150 [Anaerovoracaceae bacterium]